MDLSAFTAAVRKLVPASGGRRTAALILPDNAMRLAVLEFDNLPEKEEERMALVRFRLKNRAVRCGYRSCFVPRAERE